MSPLIKAYRLKSIIDSKHDQIPLGLSNLSMRMNQIQHQHLIPAESISGGSILNQSNCPFTICHPQISRIQVKEPEMGLSAMTRGHFMILYRLWGLENSKSWQSYLLKPFTNKSINKYKMYLPNRQKTPYFGLQEPEHQRLFNLTNSGLK